MTTRINRAQAVFGARAAGIAMAAGLVLSASAASANPSPTATYTYAHYNIAQHGDVILFPVYTTSALTQSILSNAGQQFGHVAMVQDWGASVLMDSNWTMTGLANGGTGNHSCSQPMVPSVLKTLSPGIETIGGYGTNVTVLPYHSAGSCGGSGGYMFDRFGYDNHSPNGQCADYMVYGCGVPWAETGQIYVSGAIGPVYSAVVNTVLPQLPWYTSLGCGGVAKSQIADRGAMQVLNELFWGQGSTNFHAWSPNDSVTRTTDIGPAGQPGCDDGIQYPSAMNHDPSTWPAYVNPGPTPDKINLGYVYSHGAYGIPDSFNPGGWVYSCPAPYIYDSYYGTCDTPPMSCTFWANGNTNSSITVPLGGYMPVTVQATGGTQSSYGVYWYGTHNGVTDATNVYDNAGPTPINTYPGPFNVEGDTYTRYAVIRDNSGNAVCTTNSTFITIH